MGQEDFPGGHPTSLEVKLSGLTDCNAVVLCWIKRFVEEAQV